MAKTKRCKNDKMKKRNKTQKYVKDGGVNFFRKPITEPGEEKVKKGQDTTKLKRCTVCNKYFATEDSLEDHQRRLNHAVPIGEGITPSRLGDYILNNFDVTLDNIIKQHKSILDIILADLFKYLTTDNYNKDNIKKEGYDWCRIHKLTLKEYTEFKNMLTNMKNDKPSLASLIDEIHKKFNKFESKHIEYKDDYCGSSGPLPPLPVGRPRASTPQGEAPIPPPRGRGRGLGRGQVNVYDMLKRQNPTQNAYGVAIPQRPRVNPLQTNSSVQNTANIDRLLTNNSPYDNDNPSLPPPPLPSDKKPSQLLPPPPRPSGKKPSRFRKSASSNGYKPSGPINPFVQNYNPFLK